jgi:hypothetical protein
MMDAIELCRSVAKSILSVDVELDSLVVFPIVAMTGTVQLIELMFWMEQNLMKNFFVKFSW